MSNKIKSLLYFTCFVATCIFYYQMEQKNEIENQIVKKEVNASNSKDIAKVASEDMAGFN
ncbi:hypothetical protein GGR42_003363 [Saonia flava]|uniref:Uncharacterized protein n=1 Tax=Saonia flava TaxID=523696 RepID=A0A846R4G2_9FLAO|nr:hypothetical protein [Saonia flava]NJB72865.1 hypothetical protein [Saonia flava]